jgi:hypothetical protein
MLYFYEHHKDKFYHYCNLWLSDIEFENGKIYCVRSDADDFAVLFCTGGRNDVDREFIASLLKGEADFDWWGDYDDINVYDYVIEELDDKNLEHLKKRFVQELSGKEVSSETELLETIGNEQGHDGYVTIDSTNINRIFDDEDTVNYLLDDELDSDIKSDLSRIYGYSSNASLESEYYDEVWSKLTSDHFKGNPEWITRKHNVATNKNVHVIRLEISDFDRVITDFLGDNKGYTGSSLLGYHGSFLEVLREFTECLNPRFPEYAYNPEKYINDYFSDYF